MANTRDFQEYASSGEIIDIKIGGTSINNKVATFADIPTDYLTNSSLEENFAKGTYTTIYLAGSGTLNAVATKQYVLEQLILNGSYSNESAAEYLSNTNDLTAIYVGTATFENKVAIMSDIPKYTSDYGDSNVITLLNSGSIESIYVSGTLKLATEKYVNDQNALDARKDVDAKYVEDTSYIAITADRNKNIYMTNAAAKSVSLSTNVFATNVQMAIANLSATSVKFYTPGSATINGSINDLLDAIPAYGIAYVTRCTTGFLVG